MTPFETMQLFNKVAPNRKDAYKNMQKNYLAGKVKLGLFSSSSVVIESDPNHIQKDHMLGLHEAGFIYNWHNEERAKRLAARNLEFGTRLFGTWRNTASVYRIDESVAPQAVASVIPYETPSDIYVNLPEWCVYVEMPKCKKMTKYTYDYTDENNKDTNNGRDLEVLGFWAMHDHVNVNGRMMRCLDIFMHLKQDRDLQLKDMNLIPTRLLVSPDLTIMESLRIGYPDATDEELEDFPSRKALSLLLWLCVEEPDVTNVTGQKMSRKALKEPRYARNKKTGTFVPPAQETYFDIAKRMGGDIRGYQKEIDDFEQGGRAAKRKAPHIRRGHWTGVWTGSGDNKTYKVYWQNPLFINAK